MLVLAPSWPGLPTLRAFPLPNPVILLLRTQVGDFHRTLLYGGIYGYPGDAKNKNGKLRLLYECAPMSFIAEQAGGAGSTGKERVLDIKPTEVHQRVPLFIGESSDEQETKEVVTHAQVSVLLPHLACVCVPCDTVVRWRAWSCLSPGAAPCATCTRGSIYLISGLNNACLSVPYLLPGATLCCHLLPATGSKKEVEYYESFYTKK